ncbi:MAG: ABC transporter permease [Deltaproteobacteria bacterium]|jgi:cell division transport system permease protein|nr:ABC transporter permease [Deltaproteobacteria bacterium]
MTRTTYKWLLFIRTAIRGIASSPVTSGISVVTIGVTLVLVGTFALLLRNMEELLDQFGDDLRVTAYLESEVDGEALRELEQRVREIPGVADVEAVSQDEALERFRASVGSGSALLDGLEINPLPASLEISLSEERRSAEGMEAVASAIEGLAGVESLSSGRDWVEGYLRAVALVKGVGIGLGIILALATLLIVANTIRLGVYARRDELEILSLVGASRPFVQTPFLLEGLLQGAAGGAVALALLYALFRLVLPGLEFGLELLVGTAPRFFSSGEALVVVAGGAGLGLFGSAAALSGGWRP